MPNSIMKKNPTEGGNKGRYLGGRQGYCPSSQGSGKESQGPVIIKYVQEHQKHQESLLQTNKGKTGEVEDILLEKTGDLVIHDMEKAEVLNDFFASAFSSKTSSPGTQSPELVDKDKEQNEVLIIHNPLSPFKKDIINAILFKVSHWKKNKP